MALALVDWALEVLPRAPSRVVRQGVEGFGSTPRRVLLWIECLLVDWRYRLEVAPIIADVDRCTVIGCEGEPMHNCRWPPGDVPCGHRRSASYNGLCAGHLAEWQELLAIRDAEPDPVMFESCSASLRGEMCDGYATAMAGVLEQLRGSYLRVAPSDPQPLGR